MSVYISEQFMRSIKAFSCKLILCLAFISNSLPALAGQDILLVHSYHHEHPWTAFLKEGFETAFKDDGNIRLFHEYLDAKRYPDSEFKQIFINYLKEKYTSSNLTAIVASDDAALTLIRSNRENFFPEIPIVYLGINQVDQTLIDTPNMTGVFENRNIGRTVMDIKSVTGVDEIVVITDKSSPGKANVSKIEAINGRPEAPKKIHIIDDLRDNNIAEAFKGIAENVPILLIGQLVSPNHNNALLSWNGGVEEVSKWLKNPVFTIAVTTLEYGAVGAHELHGSQHAKKASGLIKQILQGTSADDIKPITTAESEWIFNWSNMKKRSIGMDSLPMNTLVLNQDESFYEKHKLMVWIVSSAFIAAILIIIMLIEINRRGRHNQHILAENELRYKDLAHAGANIFWETNSQKEFSYVSGNTETMFQLSSQEMLKKTFNQVYESDSIVEFPWNNFQQLVNEHKSIENIIFKTKLVSDDVKIALINGHPIYGKNGVFKGYRGIIKEITQEHTLTQKLAYQATYDSLTGLINRTSFNNRLEECVTLNKQVSQQAYLCFLDLDRFKLVNDIAGHLIGDAMLAEIADVIQDCITSHDVVGRLGGDEFGIILIGKDQAQAQIICEKIISDVTNYRYHWNQRYFNVGLSIGMVPVTDNFNAMELLSKADLSCYKAKESGRNRVYIADPANQDLYSEELQMGYIANVTQVIEQNQFYLAKQLIKPLASDDQLPAHYEILIRYKDENGNQIPPGLFIPAAEKHGVIGMIDEWVLTTIFSCYEDYFPNKDTLVSINLSGITLSNDDLISKIKKLAKSSNISMENICFEITETAAISQLSQALEFIEEMKSIGIKFAIDDFGSGASSFGYLKNIPVDYLKIDGSLVKNIVTEPTDRAIVESINSIAHIMGMKTIAEFVENDQIKDVLKSIGIDYVQGYGIGRPVDC